MFTHDIRLSDDDATDYKILKEALLKRYDLTEEEYQRKFRNAKPEAGESPEQYIFRIKTYLERWIELSGTEKSYEGLSNIIMMEQFIESCLRVLAQTKQVTNAPVACSNRRRRPAREGAHWRSGKAETRQFSIDLINSFITHTCRTYLLWYVFPS